MKVIVLVPSNSIYVFRSVSETSTVVDAMLKVPAVVPGNVQLVDT